jgi:3-phenylpropionate/cinnamic acid dioxygenase small subunit
LLDQQRWPEWLALYTSDAELWVPAWESEHRVTDDPRSQLSLIYIKGHKGLEDRVWRFTSGDSPASVPLARTCHVVSNVVVEDDSARDIVVSSSWMSLVYWYQRQVLYGGRYEHTLQHGDGGLMIRRKKIILITDAVSTVLDLYHI